MTEEEMRDENTRRRTEAEARSQQIPQSDPSQRNPSIPTSNPSGTVRY